MALHGSNGGKDVVHTWAHQLTDSKRKGNVFFEGDTIYSYGYHFPMAKIMSDGKTVFFTTRTYSISTSGHLSAVRGAISHMNIIHCKDIPAHGAKFGSIQHEHNITHWKYLIEEDLKLLGKARKKEKYIESIEHTRQRVRKYIEYFEIKLKKADRVFIFETDIEGYEEGVKKATEAAAKKWIALIRKGTKLHPLWLEAWRNHNETEFAKDIPSDLRDAIKAVEYHEKDDNHVRLRTNGTVVSTTKGISIPVDVAKRYYKKYLAVVKAGGCDNNCEYKMMDFAVQVMNVDRLLVGCHDIARTEIDYIAGKLGW